MPTIANPHTVRSPRRRRRDVNLSHTRSGSITLRMTVATKRDQLTRKLAEGVDLSSSPELALRASQLTDDRRRREMVRTWRRIIADARHPSVTRMLVSIVNRRAVLEAKEEIETMIARLQSPEPVAAKGMAMAEQIVTDGLTSPLYSHTEPGTLRRLVSLATAELDSAPSELPVAA